MMDSGNTKLQGSAVSRMSTDRSEESGAEINRREALIKIGKFSAYTAPVTITLLTARKGEACMKTSDVPGSCKGKK